VKAGGEAPGVVGDASGWGLGIGHGGGAPHNPADHGSEAVDPTVIARFIEAIAKSPAHA
jgi:hypothetical protein